MGNRVSLLFLLLGVASLEAGPFYTVEILGSLGSGAALAAGINRSGNAVGWITDSQGNVNPVSFLNGQTTASGSGGQANAINNGGVAVGTLFSAGGPSVVEWAAGQTASLGVAGYGTAINNAGQVAGDTSGPTVNCTRSSGAMARWWIWELWADRRARLMASMQRAR